MRGNLFSGNVGRGAGRYSYNTIYAFAARGSRNGQSLVPKDPARRSTGFRISSNKLSTNAGSASSSGHQSGKSSRRWFVLGAASAVSVSYGLRKYLGSKPEGGLDAQGRVNSDATAAAVTLDGADDPVVVLVSTPELARLVAARSSRLDVACKELKGVAAQAVRTNVGPIFSAAAANRVPMFADYYFSYSTSLFLLKEALSTAVAHQWRSRAAHAVGADTHSSTQAAVTSHLEELLLAKYENIVLRPEINNAPLQAAFVAATQSSREAFVTAVQTIDNELNEQLARSGTSHPSMLPEPKLGKVTRSDVSLDWRAQARKVKYVPTSVEQRASNLTLPAFTIGGAIVGKLAGGAIAKTVGCTLASKLAAPFAAKAAASACAGGAAAAAGAVGGPGGALAGAMAGVVVDMTVNHVHGMLRRDDFVREVNEALDATQQHCVVTLVTELEGAVEKWVDEAKKRCVVKSSRVTDLTAYDI